MQRLARPLDLLVDHPAAAHRLAEMRDSSTKSDRFRELMGQLSCFVAYEALRDMASEPVMVTTPVGRAPSRSVSENILVVPVLRAGLAMVPGVQAIAPGTEVAHLGMRRNESTLMASTYLDGLPDDLSGRRVVICDPMLATGGSLRAACRLVAERHPARMQALCIVAAEEGLRRFHEEFPHVGVAFAALDPSLDERGFIIPGLGDAGDRLFGPAS